MPVLKSIAEKMNREHFYYNGVYGYGHRFTGGNYRYGGINICTAHACLALAMAKVCGVSIPDNLDLTLAKTIERLAPDGSMSYLWTAIRKGALSKVEKHNENGGRTGIGAMAYRLLGGRPEQYKKMINYLLLNSEHADCGHSCGGSISWFWASLALGLDGEKEFAQHMRQRLWYLNFNRQFDGGFYCQPSTHGQFRATDSIMGPHYIAAANILLLNWGRHALLLTGNKKLLPHYKAYDKEVIASSEYYSRQKRIVDVAESRALLKKKAPQSLYELERALKKLPLEAADYSKRVNSIYSKLLRQAVADVLKCGADDKSKSLAASILIGVRFSVKSVKVKDAKLTLAYKSTAINYDRLKMTISVKGQFKKSKDFVQHLDKQKALKARQILFFRGVLPKTLEAGLAIEWQGLKFTRQFQIHMNNEPLRDKWSPTRNDAIYGWFEA